MRGDHARLPENSMPAFADHSWTQPILNVDRQQAESDLLPYLEKHLKLEGARNVCLAEGRLTFEGGSFSSNWFPHEKGTSGEITVAPDNGGISLNLHVSSRKQVRAWTWMAIVFLGLATIPAFVVGPHLLFFPAGTASRLWEELPMTTSKAWLVCLALGLAIACCGLARADIIYSDDFDGSSAADLHGTAPDTRPGAQTWMAATQWKADGSKSTSANANAWLPFMPVAGNRYYLSLDVNPDISGSADWFAIGFSNGSSTTNWHTSSDQVFGWMLNRENDGAGDVVQTFVGPDTGSGASHDFNPDKVGPVKMEVVLDTQPANWTVEWREDGAPIRGPEAFATNPTINYAGFGAWNTATGVVDDFSLTSDPVGPPPLLDEVTVRVQATCDNHYQMFLSDSPTVQGALVGQSAGGTNDWQSAETFDFQVPTDKTMYLHVLGDNDDPPQWGGFIADFNILAHPAYVFGQTGAQRLVTDPALWGMTTDGWGINVVPAVSLATYGGSVWSSNADPDFPPDCHWLWNALAPNGADLLYLSAAITISTPAEIPEPATLWLVGIGLLALARRRR